MFSPTTITTLSLTLLLILLLTPTIYAHGLILSPPSRSPGPALSSVCGKSITSTIRSDPTSHVEGLPELTATSPDYNAALCNLWLCKGLQFDDNKNGTQTWYAGQIVPMKIWLRIPHEGAANVSIVDTKTNQIVEGGMLKVWASGYAPGKKEEDTPVDQREFSVVVPEGLEGRCGGAGDCVLQWWWYGVAAKQTYESCVDFKIVKGSPAVSAGQKFRA